MWVWVWKGENRIFRGVRACVCLIQSWLIFFVCLLCVFLAGLVLTLRNARWYLCCFALLFLLAVCFVFFFVSLFESNNFFVCFFFLWNSMIFLTFFSFFHKCVFFVFIFVAYYNDIQLKWSDSEGWWLSNVVSNFMLFFVWFSPFSTACFVPTFW